MRCSISIAYALISNHNYADIGWVKESAIKNATADFKKQGNCRYLRHLPSSLAREIMTPEMGKIIRSQKPSGGWKVKKTRYFTYYYLQAIVYSGLDSVILPKLRHDPISFLKKGDDAYAVAAERLWGKTGLSQSHIEGRVKHITDLQGGNGSWENTVISTAHHLELLHEAGLDRTNKFVKNGVRFILDSLIVEVPSTTKHYFGRIVAKNMFSSLDRHKEFESALKYKPEWNPVGLCYMHIPNIQNAYAIEIMNLIGYQDDLKVRTACDNLIDLYKKYGGFCETNIRKNIIGK